MNGELPIMPCPSKLPSLGVFVWVVGTIHQIDVEDRQFWGACRSFSFDDKESSFGVKSHRPDFVDVLVDKVLSYDAADAVDLSAKASGIEIIAGQAQVGFIVVSFFWFSSLAPHGLLYGSYRCRIIGVDLHFLQEEQSGPIMSAKEVSQRGSC